MMKKITACFMAALLFGSAAAGMAACTAPSESPDTTEETTAQVSTQAPATEAPIEAIT